jgi:hypothetical protein
VFTQFGSVMMTARACGWSLLFEPDLTLPCGCSYLVLFLKFIASIVPTIQYDYTMSVGH